MNDCYVRPTMICSVALAGIAFNGTCIGAVSQRKLIDMKDLYREETNKDVYAEDCCMQPSSSYSDEYVHWLEAKLRQYNVIESLSQDNFCKVCNLPTDGEKCYSNRCPI